MSWMGVGHLMHPGWTWNGKEDETVIVNVVEAAEERPPVPHRQARISRVERAEGMQEKK
jgi:hypothetical protein